MITKLNNKPGESEIQDELFADLVEELSALVDSGQLEMAGELIDQHPQYADCLRRLLPAIEALASLDEVPNPLLDNSASRQLGDFRLIRELGRGGMGVVYEAEQISLGRRIALKVLPLAATVTHQKLQRFKNEARAAATLKHAHIVGVYSVGVERGVHYYAMELIEGRSLAQAIAELRAEANKSTPADPADDSPAAKTSPVAALSTVRTTDAHDYFRQAARLIADAADALDYAHAQGVVHRDVKPANLLIDEESHVWITDFGLARLESDAGVTLTGDILGTLRYMSPEQAAGKPNMVDYRTDIHALGATLYELITLHPPFDCDDRAELLRQVIDQPPRSPCQLDPRLPKDLETIICKAMEKEPIDRYESAGQLAADLHAFAEHRPITARPPSLGVRMHKWARRHFTAVAVSLVVLLLGIIGLSISTAMIGHQRSVALRNATKASDNYQLALAALDKTLAESVVGELIVEPIVEKRRELQQQGIDFYEQLAAKNSVAPTRWPAYQLLVFNKRFGEAYDLQQTDPAAAEEAFQDAIELAQALVAATDGDPDNRAQLIHAIDDYANLLGIKLGRTEEAIGESQRAAELITRLKTDCPDFRLNAYLEGKNLYNRSVFQEHAERLDEAERLCREALPQLVVAVESQPDSSEAYDIRVLAMCRYNLGFYLWQRGEHIETRELWLKSLKDWLALTAMRPVSSEFNSRAGATFSNLAILARQRGDFHECRQLAEEALVYQKRAINLKPTYELAKNFLAKHYKELSLALSSLHEREALAAIAEERVSNLPDVTEEYCAAAMSLGDCLEQLYRDESYTGDDRLQIMNRYAERAFAILDEASQRFQDNLSIFTVGRAYVTLGDGCLEMDRTDDARRAWLSAERQYKRVQAAVAPEDRHEFDEYLETTRRRTESLKDES